MWQEIDNKLVKHFDFDNFTQALGFVNKVGQLAESVNHHPDIKFGWGYVEISITTHNEGGITDKDRSMAEAIDQIK